MTPNAATGARQDQRHEYLRTSCGRELTVGRLSLGDGRHPAQRIFVDLGDCPGCDGTRWAGLTVTEARHVARALLSQAAAAERDGQAQAGPARLLTVRYVNGESYAVTVRGHSLIVDQPETDGGHDAAATPTELLVASFASCVAFYAGRYLLRHGLDRTGLTVSAEFAMASSRPARVGDVRLRISVPAGIPAQRSDALLAVASHCTVHNTLRRLPSVNIELA